METDVCCVCSVYLHLSIVQDSFKVTNKIKWVSFFGFSNVLLLVSRRNRIFRMFRLRCFFFVYIFPCLHGYYDVASSRLIYVFAVLGLVLSFICCNSNRNWIMDNFSCFVVLRLEQNAISSLFLNWCYHITFVLFRGGSDF